MNLCPLVSKCRLLTIRPPGRSLFSGILNEVQDLVLIEMFTVKEFILMLKVVFSSHIKNQQAKTILPKDRVRYVNRQDNSQNGNKNVLKHRKIRSNSLTRKIIKMTPSRLANIIKNWPHIVLVRLQGNMQPC